jgi:hypothetical protein
MASANSIGYLDSQLQVTFTTDGSYTLTLPQFNTDGGLYVLNSASMYFYAAESVTSLALTNAALGTETLNIYDNSNPVRNSTNTANNADRYINETLDIIDTGIGPGLAQPNENFSGALTFGGTGTPACPEYEPSASCSSVLFVPPNINIQNIDAVYGLPTGTGLEGLTGVVKVITGADLLNYTGLGTFNLTGATLNTLSANGGGGNVSLGVATNATFEAEIDYSYTINNGTPEPSTMALLGGALLGLGFIGKRFRKS